MWLNFEIWHILSVPSGVCALHSTKPLHEIFNTCEIAVNSDKIKNVVADHRMPRFHKISKWALLCTWMRGNWSSFRLYCFSKNFILSTEHNSGGGWCHRWQWIQFDDCIMRVMGRQRNIYDTEKLNEEIKLIECWRFIT